MELTLEQLAEHLQAAQVVSQGAVTTLKAVAALDEATEHDVTFVTADRHLAAAAECRAGAVLVVRARDEISVPQLVVQNVDAALIQCLELFAPPLRPVVAGIHPSAVVADDVALGQEVSVGPGAVIDHGARIGDRCVLAAGCKIGQNTVLGTHTRLDSNVVVYHNCKIGSNVIIQANTVIGAVGFGYATLDGAHRLFPHNGAVVIEDFVDIGANCCIDRAKFANTIVGKGTKMDNQVQVGHNVVIGKGCLIAGQVGIAGSCTLGDGVVVGGKAALADNITIGAGAVIGAVAGVLGNVPAGQTVVWSPGLEQSQAKRVVGEILRLPKTASRVKQLIKRLDKLEAAENDKG